MDMQLFMIESIGEVGLDTEASPGNGQYYVKLYDGSYDAVGFDSVEEAVAELEHVTDLDISQGWPQH
jgi:hypothetical protein